MYQLKLEGQLDVTVYTFQDFHESLLFSEHPICKILDIVKEISEHLEINCPDVALVKQEEIQLFYPYQVPLKRAKLIYAEEIPSLSNHLLLLSDDLKEPYTQKALIAHELRYLSQKIYHPSYHLHPVDGYPNLLFYPAEIDADAFAISFLIKKDFDIDTAGNIVCPYVKELDEVAYTLRIKRAASIQKGEQSASQ